MIIKLEELRSEYDIVIVGAGIAGLGLSRLLNTEKKKVLIVESGNFKFDNKANKRSFALSKNLGNWPSENYASFHSRLRMFGGNSNVWGGWCMELDEFDYSQNKIWGDIKNDLKSHYKIAYELLNINPKFISSSELSLNSVQPYSINISRGNFKNESKDSIESNQNVDLILNTYLNGINFESNNIKSINIETNMKELKTISLQKLVISTGGIESAKILQKQIPDNLKNSYVGKHFMEHPQLQVGRVKIKDKDINTFIKKYSPPTAKHLFDDKLNKQEDKYFSGFKSTNSNIRNYFVLRTSDVYQSKALYRLRHIILTQSMKSTGKIKLSDLYELTRDLVDMFMKKITSKISNKKSYSVVLHLEQKPNYHNQIYFDDQYNTVLDWNFTEDDFDNLEQSLEDLHIIFKEMNSEFDLKNIFKQNKKQILDYLGKNIFGIGHHMGTTIMGNSKNNSVCDTDLKYHGIENLFVNSTSVFPSGGIANPTLTMLALTSRLADKLNKE